MFSILLAQFFSLSRQTSTHLDVNPSSNFTLMDSLCDTQIIYLSPTFPPHLEYQSLVAIFSSYPQNLSHYAMQNSSSRLEKKVFAQSKSHSIDR